MTETPVLRERVADGVAIVRLNRPAKRNALDTAALALLNDTLDELAADATLRALVFSTKNTRALCAGAEAIGLGDRLGQVRAGFLADLQVVALDDLNAGPGGAVASRLVYATERAQVRHVVVDGAVLVEGGKLTRWAREAIAATARSELAGCLQRADLG